MTFEELINWINNRQTEWTDGFSPIDEVIKMHTHISSLEAENKDLRGRAEKAETTVVEIEKTWDEEHEAHYLKNYQAEVAFYNRVAVLLGKPGEA